MTNPLKTLVFDFDGTLVQSTRPKFEAWFDVFPQGVARGDIQSVLDKNSEESRYVIIEMILRKAGLVEDLEKNIERLAGDYNDIVLNVAKTCPETHRAEELLRGLKDRYRLYLSSNTPELHLKDIVRHRQLDGYFLDIFGYPRLKEDTLRLIMAREKITRDEILMIGDAATDQRAARTVGCGFIQVRDDDPWTSLQGKLPGWNGRPVP